MRYNLRTLLIVLAIGPPVLAVAGWLLNESWLMAIPLSILFAPVIGRLLGWIATRRQRQETIAALKARGVKLPKGFRE